MFGKRAARYNEYCCKQRNFMLLSWQYLSSNQFSGQIFWDNSYMDQIFKENLLYSKMWSNNYMYSVLVKDYRCTQLHLRMLCHENYISAMSVVQHNQYLTNTMSNVWYNSYHVYCLVQHNQLSTSAT